MVCDIEKVNLYGTIDIFHFHAPFVGYNVSSCKDFDWNIDCIKMSILVVEIEPNSNQID